MLWNMIYRLSELAKEPPVNMFSYRTPGPPFAVSAADTLVKKNPCGEG